LKIPINSGLRQAGITHPLKMALVSWFNQILFLRLWLVVSRYLANLSKSSSGIWLISASHLPELLGWERMQWLILKVTCQGLENADSSL
jgi:hypothetical protein